MKKKCNKCGAVKSFSEYHKDRDKKDGVRTQCKKCSNEEKKEYSKKNKLVLKIRGKKYRDNNTESLKKRKAKYYQDNREKILEKAKVYSLKNKEHKKEYSKHYGQENKISIRLNKKKYLEKNRNSIKEKRKKYNSENKDKLNQKRKKRYERNVNFRISSNLRSRIGCALGDIAKSASTMDMFGCTVEELKIHLEKQFKGGMSWENKGYYGWHIDHIRPCVSFDLSDPAQQGECFHYTNLQPLWAVDNLSKGATYL